MKIKSLVDNIQGETNRMVTLLIIKGFIIGFIVALLVFLGLTIHEYISGQGRDITPPTTSFCYGGHSLDNKYTKGDTITINLKASDDVFMVAGLTVTIAQPGFGLTAPPCGFPAMVFLRTSTPMT